jgi:tetratricopeptide (TPR) repeat protein
MKYARILVLLVMAIGCASPAYAQLGSIFGNVLDKDGKPLVGATVAIDRDEVKFHAEVKTDKNGNYQRMGVADGNYRITVMQDGKAVTSVFATVSLGFRVDKNIDLRTAGSAPAAGAPTISKAQQDAEKKANSDTGGAFNAGLTALNARNYDEAIKQFTTATQKQPKSYIIFGRLAETYEASKKNPEAIDAYKKAIELKADEPEYHFHLGMLLIQTGSMADAAASFDKYLQLAPKSENAAMAKQLSDAAKAQK